MPFFSVHLVRAQRVRAGRVKHGFSFHHHVGLPARTADRGQELPGRQNGLNGGRCESECYEHTAHQTPHYRFHAYTTPIPPIVILTSLPAQSILLLYIHAHIVLLSFMESTGSDLIDDDNRTTLPPPVRLGSDKTVLLPCRTADRHLSYPRQRRV